MINVHIGGVPEHFNLAWYLSLKDKLYQDKGINLRWHDYHGGTGQMNKALREGDIDLAVILTEGIIKDITEGNPSKIVQTFVASPLIWGIHVAANSNYNNVNQLRGKKAAISRWGSGSHLMTYINAKQHSWDLENDLNFEIIGDLKGAIKGLSHGDADYFMWEKFTTKPLVDNGVFRHVADCPTPWPCFVIAARDTFINQHKLELKIILDIINDTTKTFKNIPAIDEMIAERYQQNIKDVRLWLSLTKWSQDQISKSVVERIQQQLLDLNIISFKIDYKKLVVTL